MKLFGTIVDNLIAEKKEIRKQKIETSETKVNRELVLAEITENYGESLRKKF